MRTTRTFGTISYNTTEFLKIKLNELVQQRVLDFWVFVEHVPEDDETKKHKHLYCVPVKQYDTSNLIEYLSEIDPNNPLEKPLGIIPCRPSKFADWYLYSCHHKGYLASKGQSRKHYYSDKDFVTSNSDYFLDLRHTIDYTSLNRTQQIIEAVDNGISFSKLVTNGQVPIQLVRQYEIFYNIISSSRTNRNGRDGHEIIENGEILN